MKVSLNGVLFSASVCLVTSPLFGKIATQDQEVLRQIHLNNQLEIKLGHLAESKGSTAEIRQYGHELAADHELADTKVKEAASKERVIATNPIPAVDEPAERREAAIMKNLEGKMGADFDECFTTEMAKSHKEAIASLTVAEEKLKGSPTAVAIAQILPSLNRHRATAERLNSK